MSILKKIVNLFWPLSDSGLFPFENKADYFSRAGHKEVEGWLSSHTLALVHFIDRFQQNNTIRGSVIEIGVFHGRFFIALCLLLRRGERALAVDVFEDQEFNLDGAGIGDYGIFSANLLNRLGTMENICILKSDSLKIQISQLIKELSGQKVRLFSIDGCHTVQHTENDLMLASQVIEVGGVIILDDFENRDWPGVAEGANQFLQKVGNVIPIVIAYNKLYLTTIDWAARYQAFIEKIVAAQTDNVEYLDIWGHRVLRALMPIPETLFLSDRQVRIDFSSLSPEPRKYLGSGWSFSEPWGVWSDGGIAELIIEVPKSLRGDLRMIIAFHGYVTEQYPEMTINIQVNTQPVEMVCCRFGEEYQTRTCILPAGRQGGHDMVWVRFDIPQPKSPKELGLARDSRVLGVGLRSIFFEECCDG
ncbi:MAG: class I SAM-dependent methyltransferase [Desulfobulbaceae bacterium]|nr:class I SAM-dependent methyltransferase [Desulfobulbaceae bacterium]